MTLLDEARSILPLYNLQGGNVSPVAIGLINRTFRVEAKSGVSYILQRVNPIFTPRVHEDIEAVTAHLEKNGMRTPRLVRSKDGGLYVEHEGAVWRVLTFIEGLTHERLSSPEQAHEAGILLARFHRGVSDLSHDFKNRRLGVHDTPKHLASLERALEEHRDRHARFDVLAPLGSEILHLSRALPSLPFVEDRIVHGDPKISNLLFDATSGRGVAVVDLDTLAKMPLPLELGDAFRSWSNPSGEDHRTVRFSLDLFRAAVDGYAREASGFIEDVEWRSIVGATLTIIVELASRFAADSLNESYFGWDASRYATRSEHNEVRARGQLSLARSLMEQRSEAEEIVDRAFEAGSL
jgi:Ser/Thr protein kinase RdoA (MazF antagonist)